MIGTIAFGALLVGAYFLNDKQEELQEYLLELIDGSYFLEHKSEILIFTIPTIVILLVTYWVVEKRHKREMIRYNSSLKITPEEYERNKKILTDEAIKNLIESPEYLQYQANKQKGELKEIELTEDDKIVLSDDSDEEREEEQQLKKNEVEIQDE